MFYDINKSLCETYTGLDPLRLLDYPAEDVFSLIEGLISYNERNREDQKAVNNGVIRKAAGDNWF